MLMIVYPVTISPNTSKISIHVPGIKELALSFCKVILTSLRYSLVCETSFSLRGSCWWNRISLLVFPCLSVFAAINCISQMAMK